MRPIKPAIESLDESFERLGRTAMQIKSQRDSLIPLVKAICKGYDYDPGSSDLDDEQPITVRMSLGDYRLACRAKAILLSE